MTYNPNEVIENAKKQIDTKSKVSLHSEKDVYKLKKQMREEWLNRGYWIGDSIDKDLVPEVVMNKIADWWIEKFDQTLNQIEEELEGEKEFLKTLYVVSPTMSPEEYSDSVTELECFDDGFSDATGQITGKILKRIESLDTAKSIISKLRG